MSVTFSCSQCGQRYKVADNLAGRKMRCKTCDTAQTIPDGGPAPPADLYDLDLDDVPPVAKTGEAVDWSEAEDNGEAVPRLRRPGRPSRFPSRGAGPSSGFPVVGVILGASLGLVLLLAILGIFSEGFAIACMAVGIALGVLITQACGLWMIINAFREDVVVGLLYLFVPFYGLYHLITRWEVQRRPFLLSLGGVLVMLVGLGAGFGLAAMHKSSEGQAASTPAAPGSGEAPTGPEAGPSAPEPGFTPTPPPGFTPTMPPGFTPPMPPGFVPPGFAPPGLTPPPGFMPPGFMPPGMIPPSMPPGAMPPGVIPRPTGRARRGATNPPQFPPGGGSFAGGATPTAPAPSPPVQAPAGGGFRRPAGGFAAAPADWKVAVDPRPEPAGLEGITDLAITIPGPYENGSVVFPAFPSRFVAVGRNRDANEVREVWDVGFGRRVARVPGKVEIEGPFALSGDGRYLAGRSRGKNEAVVLDVRDGQEDLRVPFDHHKPDYLEFAGDDRVVFAGFWTKEIDVWDVPGKKKVATIRLDPLNKEAIAPSPGGAYLAAISDHQLIVFRLADGEVVGTQPLPRFDGQWDLNGKGLAFSPDGKELAALCEAFGKTHLVVWDVATGGQPAMLGPYDRDAIKSHFGAEVAALEWLPRNEGWLVQGEAIVERRSGKKVWSLPFDNDDYKAAPRRIVNDGRALVVLGRDARRRLVAAPLEAEKIAAAIKLAREGGDPMDATRPTAKAASLAGARRIDPPARSVAWSAKPDPKPASAKGVGGRPVPLACKPGEVSKVLFSKPAAAIAAVSSQPGKRLGIQGPDAEGRPIVVDRLDLPGGKPLGARRSCRRGATSRRSAPTAAGFSPGTSRIRTGSTSTGGMARTSPGGGRTATPRATPGTSPGPTSWTPTAC